MARPTPNTYMKDALYQLSTQGIQVDDTAPLYSLRNFARRQYGGEHPWSFRQANDALTFSASGSLYSAPLPTDIDERFPVTVWDVVSGRKVDFDPAEYYNLFEAGASNRFYLDRLNGRVLSTSSTGFIQFQKAIDDLPNDASADLTPDVFPDTTAISWKLAAMYINSTDQETGLVNLFEDNYSAQVAADLKRESGFQPILDIVLPVTPRR